MIIKFCILVFLICALIPKSKAHLSLFEVTVNDEKQLKQLLDMGPILKKMSKRSDSVHKGFDWWKQPKVGQPARFSADGDETSVNEMKAALKEVGITGVAIVTKDLETQIKSELRQNAVAKARSQFRSSGTGSGITSYFARHAEYNKWLQTLKKNNPSLVSLQNIGKSYEKRDMVVAKVSTGGSNKPAIFLDGGIHAREWLAISSVVYILNEFIVKYKHKDPQVTKILQKYDLYVLPVTNPDGYELTHSGGKYRMWRKNVMPVPNGCFGVDLNRNFDADFGVSGVSKNPCEIIYPGEKPFNAPETRNFRDFVNSIKNRLKLFVSFHAFSQLLLTPYGYTKKYPSDNADLMRVAHKMTDAIEATSGLKYQAGSPAHILYPASGGCYDWVKLKAGVKYSYTFEVRPTGRDRRGFMAPPQWIKPAGDELFAGVVAAALSV